MASGSSRGSTWMTLQCGMISTATLWPKCCSRDRSMHAPSQQPLNNTSSMSFEQSIIQVCVCRVSLKSKTPIMLTYLAFLVSCPRARRPKSLPCIARSTFLIISLIISPYLAQYYTMNYPPRTKYFVLFVVVVVVVALDPHSRFRIYALLSPRNAAPTVFYSGLLPSPFPCLCPSSGL